MYILSQFVNTLYTRHLLIWNLIINFTKICVTEKGISDWKEMTENINDRSETEFASVEDPWT